MSEFIIEVVENLRDGIKVVQKEDIVRCRDCKRYMPITRACKFKHPRHGVQWRAAEPDGFCKWGERRSE